MLDSPIILLGTHRSGSTWLGKVFSQHPILAYCEEPRHIWSWGNNYKPDDVLTAQDASPRIVEHIRRYFSHFVQMRGRQRLFEKTPSNCLRIPFIRQVYPEAKMLHIIRDGRSVFSSAEQLMASGYYRQSVLNRRLRNTLLETPLWQWPANASRVMDILQAKLTKQPIKFWGPRPKGWRHWVKHDSPNVILAKQWAAIINQAIQDSESIDQNFYYRIYYEDLVSRPRDIMSSIIDFLEIDDVNSFIHNFEKTVDPTRRDQWSTLLPESKITEIRPYMESTLKQLGYSW